VQAAQRRLDDLCLALAQQFSSRRRAGVFECENIASPVGVEVIDQVQRPMTRLCQALSAPSGSDAPRARDLRCLALRGSGLGTLASRLFPVA